MGKVGIISGMLFFNLLFIAFLLFISHILFKEEKGVHGYGHENYCRKSAT